jgi:hypothetical protein
MTDQERADLMSRPPTDAEVARMAEVKSIVETIPGARVRGQDVGRLPHAPDWVRVECVDPESESTKVWCFYDLTTLRRFALSLAVRVLSEKASAVAHTREVLAGREAQLRDAEAVVARLEADVRSGS